MQIKGGPLLQKQLVHNATIASIVPRWQTFEASQFDLQVRVLSHTYCSCSRQPSMHYIALLAQQQPIDSGTVSAIQTRTCCSEP